MIGDRAEAEDSVQEAYARAWQRWERLRGYGDPEAWVRTVAYRIAVSSWRKAFSRARAHRRHGPAEDLPGLEPNQTALTQALAQLNADQRRALVLHHVVGLSVAEISAEAGAPEGTVKSWLSRGRRSLAEQLSGKEQSHV
jgi:RNA polymerase sigma-70 factor (ECF subfamily)